MSWQPIETAPKDGTVILTDDGTAKYANFWGIYPGWYLCTTYGDIPSCADNGYGISAVSPIKWMRIPEGGPIENH